MIHVEDLEAWLEAYYLDMGGVPSVRQDFIAAADESHTVARRMCGVVRSMRNMPWNYVREVLDAFFHAIECMQESSSNCNSSEDEIDRP